MDGENYHWVITFNSNGPKVDIVRQTTGTPMLECPSEREMTPGWNSGIYLSKEKGTKINMIRFIYSLCLLNLFRDKHGNKVPMNKVFEAFGKLLHVDFTRYNNDLTRTVEESTSIRKQTEIFHLMSDVLLEKLSTRL